MGDKTNISWTDATWNCVRGCSVVSPGCTNCYAMKMASRFDYPGGAYEGLTVPGKAVWNGRIMEVPDKLDQPLRWRRPRRIFVNSMSDLFHESVSDEFIARVWQTMGCAPQHDYQILTKRSERMRDWCVRWYAGEIAEPYEERPVPGFPNYKVTTTGEVRGKRVDLLKAEAGDHGHLRVRLYRAESGPHGEAVSLHRLVLGVFTGRAGVQSCHRNGDPSDNRLSNLYWGSHEDNWRDRKAHGNRRSYSKLTVAQVGEIRSLDVNGMAATELAERFNVSDTQIRNIVSGRQWKPSEERPRVAKPGRVVLPCVHLGVSVEDQKRLEERVPELLATPAAVRFVSAEPLLGPLNFSPLHVRDEKYRIDRPASIYALRGCYQVPDCHLSESHPALDWVICGGESGHRARPCAGGWIRDIVQQCRAADVPVFVKQLGARVLWSEVEEHSDWLLHSNLKDSKGADLSEWPTDLQVQEFPREVMA